MNIGVLFEKNPEYKKIRKLFLGKMKRDVFLTGREKYFNEQVGECEVGILFTIMNLWSRIIEKGKRWNISISSFFEKNPV